MGDCFAPLGPPLLPWDSMAQTDKQTNRQTDMATPRPTRPSGAEMVKITHKHISVLHLHTKYFTFIIHRITYLSFLAWSLLIRGHPISIAHFHVVGIISLSRYCHCIGVFSLYRYCHRIGVFSLYIYCHGI